MNLRLLPVLCGLLAACEPDFDPYNELTGLRVLYVRADAPELVPGETATLDAMLNYAGGAPSQRWSLCPYPADANSGFPCPVDQTTWQRVWIEAGLAGTAPALALGSEATSTITYPGDYAEARALCEALTRELASAPSLPPDCARAFPWTVRLTVQQGGARVDTVKDVTLLLHEDLIPNQNPSLTALQVDGMAFPATGALDLKVAKEHRLMLAVPDDAAETYLPAPALGEEPRPAEKETLLFTWFVTQGETEFMRTVYKEGVEPLDEALRNRWTAPKERGAVTLTVVVRDPRGGVGSLSRQVRLIE